MQRALTPSSGSAKDQTLGQLYELWLLLRFLRARLPGGAADELGPAAQSDARRVEQLLAALRLSPYDAPRELPTLVPWAGPARGPALRHQLDGPHGLIAIAARTRQRVLVAAGRSSRATRLDHLRNGRIREFCRSLVPRGAVYSGLRGHLLTTFSGARPPSSPHECRLAVDESVSWQYDAQASWPLPPFLMEWLSPAGERRVTLLSRGPRGEEEPGLQQLSFWDRRLLAAFLPRDAGLNPRPLASLAAPLSAEEVALLPQLFADKAPGPCGCKLSLLDLFSVPSAPGEATAPAASNAFRDLLAALVQGMIVTGHVPSELVGLQVAYLEKAEGGHRPVALFPELMKAAETILGRRLSRALGQDPGHVVSTANSAYAAGRGIDEILSMDRHVSEACRITGRRFGLAAGDHHKWFDVLRREVIAAKLDACGADVQTCLFVEAYCADQLCSSTSSHGPTPGRPRGAAGIPQGGGLSPPASKLAQDPAQRLIDDELEAGAGLVVLGERVPAGAYSDDWLWFLAGDTAAEVEASRRRVSLVAGLAWSALGIPTKPTALLASPPPAVPLYLRFWDFAAGTVGQAPFRSWSDGARRLLGVSRFRDGSRAPQTAHLSAVLSRGLSALARRTPSWEELPTALQLCVISKAVFAPLDHSLTVAALRSHDLQVANMARRALGVHKKVSRHLFHSPATAGGLGLPLVSAEVALIAPARELQHELLRPGPAGDLARALWDAMLDCSPLPHPLPRMVALTKLLASHGIYVRDLRRMEAGRVLGVLARRLAPAPASLTAQPQVLARSQALCERFSLFTILEKTLHRLLRPGGLGCGPAGGTVRFWRSHLPPGVAVTPKSVARAVQTARQERARDWSADCQMVGCFGLPRPSSESHSAWNECPRDSALAAAISLLPADVALACDGGSHGACFGTGFVAFRPPAPSQAFPLGSALGQLVLARALPLPPYYGHRRTTVRDAELNGILNCVLRLDHSPGSPPIVVDAQAEMARTLASWDASVRRELRESCTPLASRIGRWLRLHSVPDRGPDTWRDLARSWAAAVPEKCRVFSDCLLGRPFVWQRSHTPRPAAPAELPFALNRAADEQATKAAGLAGRASPHPLRYPAGLPTICFELAGSAVTSDAARAIRAEVARRAAQMAAELRWHGRVLALHEALEPSTMHPGAWQAAPLSAEQDRRWDGRRAVDATADLPRLYVKQLMGLQGCHTSQLHSSQAYCRRVAAHRGLRGPAARPYSPEMRQCPFCPVAECGAAPGTLRHLVYSCRHPALVAVREQMLREVEAAAASLAAEAEVAPPARSPDLLEPSDGDAYPFLSAVPVLLRRRAAAALDRGAIRESAEDLMHRLVLPLSFLSVLGISASARSSRGLRPLARAETVALAMRLLHPLAIGSS